MCGIVGIYGDDLNVNTHDKKNFLIEGAVVDSVRGYEATGIFSMARNTKSDGHRLYKRALAGYDFVQLKQFNKIVDQMSSSIGMVVHNRASTRGHGGLDSNSHPFRHGHITLVHNGTVTNAPTLVPKKDQPDNIQVDSSYVAHAFAHESPEDMLPRLQGGYSLVWHDSTDNTLHFARNDAKPMFIAFDETREVIYFGSEVRMITWLCDRNNIKIQKDIFSTTPYVHYVFRDPKKVREIQKFPFVLGRLPTKQAPLKQLPALSTSTTTPTIPSASTTKTEPKIWLPSSQEAVVTPGIGKDLIGKTSTSTVHESVGKVLQLPAKTEERINQLNTLLMSAGLVPGKNVVGIPRSWAPYNSKGVQSLTGIMTCYRQGDESKKDIFQVFNVSEERWRNEFSGNRIAVLEVVNFRDKSLDNGQEFMFVCRIAEGKASKHPDAAEGGAANEEEPRTILQKAMAARPHDYIQVGTSRKRHVHINHFRRLTNDGCYNCLCSLPEHLATTIMWIGKDDDKPLCAVCSTDMQIVTSMANVH